MKLVPPSLPRLSYVSSSFGLYCSACLGKLFVSILCMCCSHFSWFCFISFSLFSAPVFSLIHWFFFLYLVLLFQVGDTNTNLVELSDTLKTEHSQYSINPKIWLGEKLFIA
jgi:hypothetical protein